MALLVILLLVASMTASCKIETPELWHHPWLPGGMRPIHYDLFIRTRISERKFDGRVSIEIKILAPTTYIIVHADLADVFGTEVILNHTSLTVIRAFIYFKYDYWVVETGEEMLAGDTVILNLKFKGEMGWNRGIAERGFYDREERRRSPLVVTVFKPVHARMAFPCFDEPFYKSRFTITLRHWANLTAVSNMPEYSVTKFGTEWHETKFKRTPPISSFAVGFVISDLVSRNETLQDGKLCRVWSRPEEVSRVQLVLTVTTLVQEYFNNELGNITWLPKIDHFAIPHFFGRGHAHWGLINYDEDRLHYNVFRRGDKDWQRNLVIMVTALAQNYFGNLVTCESWTHVWLDFGLAHFYGLKAIAPHESVSHEEQELKEQGLYQDAFDSSRPLALSRYNRSEGPPDISSPILLSKGAAVLKMMENFLGAETFNRGIREYIREHSFKTTLTRDLFGAFQSVVDEGTRITEIMQTWVYSMGYPLITIQLLHGFKINATQKRFLMEPFPSIDRPPTSHGYRWYVPLNYRTKLGKSGRVWMNRTDVVFPDLLSANDNWIVFNNDQSGYYRVNYERHLWDNIIRQLKSNHTVFTDLERSQLLSDALNVAKAEQLEYDVALNLTMYASKETSLSSWTHLYKALKYIHMMLGNTSDFPSCQRYILNLTTNVMNEVKVDISGLFQKGMLREKIMSLSCSAGHRGCIENTTKLFKQWINNDILEIPVFIRRLVICIGIANSVNETDWKETFTRFFEKRGPTVDSESLLLGLACTKNVTLVERLLDTSFSNDDVIRLWFPELNKAVIEFSKNPAIIGYVWEWLKDNHLEIDGRYFHGASAKLAYEATYYFNTDAQLRDVRHFFDLIDSTEEMEEIRTLTDLKIKDNIRWMYVHNGTVSRWLQENFPV